MRTSNLLVPLHRPLFRALGESWRVVQQRNEVDRTEPHLDLWLEFGVLRYQIYRNEGGGLWIRSKSLHTAAH